LSRPGSEPPFALRIFFNLPIPQSNTSCERNDFITHIPAARRFTAESVRDGLELVGQSHGRIVSNGSATRPARRTPLLCAPRRRHTLRPSCPWPRDGVPLTLTLMTSPTRIAPLGPTQHLDAHAARGAAVDRRPVKSFEAGSWGIKQDLYCGRARSTTRTSSHDYANPPPRNIGRHCMIDIGIGAFLALVALVMREQLGVRRQLPIHGMLTSELEPRRRWSCPSCSDDLPVSRRVRNRGRGPGVAWVQALVSSTVVSAASLLACIGVDIKPYLRGALTAQAPSSRSQCSLHFAN